MILHAGMGIFRFSADFRFFFGPKNTHLFNEFPLFWEKNSKFLLFFKDPIPWGKKDYD
jgi:hypothetical protein